MVFSNGASKKTKKDPCEILEWDTNYFGKRIARVLEPPSTASDLKRINSWCVERKIDCLYYLVNVADINRAQLAEKDGFQLVDIRVTVECQSVGTTQAKSSPPKKNVVRKFNPDDIGNLTRIAGEVHGNTRFSNDRRFNVNKVHDMYKLWIKKSCFDNYADQVFVACDSGGHAIGYISCRMESSLVGNIGLLGVAASYQGKGFGIKLIEVARDWFRNKKTKSIITVTQGTTPGVLQFYQKAGFLIKKTELWLHKWF